ncbi:MAG: hypothetical protein FJ395_03785 [Verrucomicrobia bacterium]|nr:hypothetical protein [Verrucomicrobiota bacterium]
MSRENVQFETAVLVSLALHVALLSGWEQRAMLVRVPVVGSIVKALTPAPKPVVVAQAKTTEPIEPVITFVEEKETPPLSVPAPAPPARPKQFIETDSNQVTGEKPKETDFYSDRSTVAANLQNPTAKTGEMPYLDGKDTRMLSTEDVTPRRTPPGVPLPPSRPTPPSPPSPAPAHAMLAPSKPAASAPLLKPLDLPRRPPQEAKPEVKSLGENKGLKEGTERKGALEKPKPVPEEGLKTQPETKLAMLTPPPTPKTVPMPPPEPPQPETPPAKPELSLPQPPPVPPSPPSSPAGGTGSAGSGSEREIAARKSRLTSVGVTRLGIPAFNVAESPFGAYDKAIVRAVQSRWYALIEKNALYERAGEVTIHFQLLPDGSVTNAEVKATTAGEILALFCQKAIVESAPFAPWPEQLRAYLGNEPRDVDFTFYY